MSYEVYALFYAGGESPTLWQLYATLPLAEKELSYYKSQYEGIALRVEAQTVWEEED